MKQKKKNRKIKHHFFAGIKESKIKNGVYARTLGNAVRTLFLSLLPMRATGGFVVAVTVEARIFSK